MPLSSFLDAWSRRSTRERKLAGVTALVLLIPLVFGLIAFARGVLHGLDQEIARLTDELVNNRRQMGLRTAVEARFAAVANQHSSAWTESEIRDRLRQEVYRLSNLVPPELDPSGVPVSTDNGSGYLVRVPELGRGRLAPGGEGFREYELEFTMPPAPITDIAAYLERLMESPQSLRIDQLDLRRDPGRSDFAAALAITRIVVDDPGVESGATTPDVASIPLDPARWTAVGGVIEPGDGGELRVRATEAQGECYLERVLPAGARFDLSVELRASQPATIAIHADGVPLAVKGPNEIPGDGRWHRCRLQFTLPEGAGRVTTRFPHIAWRGEGAELGLRALRLVPIGEAAP